MTTPKTVYEREEHLPNDDDWPPNDARGCVAWFTAKLAAIPEAALATAEIDVTCNWDGSGPMIEVTYQRPETDTERIAREADELATTNAQRQEDLRELNRLARRLGKVVR